MANRTVAKFRIVSRGSTEARVRPPSDICEKQDTGDPPQAIKFINLTSDAAWVRLPGNVFAGQPNPFVIGLAARGTAGDSQKLAISGAVNGLFSFKVFCDETFSFAEGNSDPEFIIEN